MLHLSVRPLSTVCSKTKKNKIGVNVPQCRSNRCTGVPIFSWKLSGGSRKYAGTIGKHVFIVDVWTLLRCYGRTNWVSWVESDHSLATHRKTRLNSTQLDRLRWTNAKMFRTGWYRFIGPVMQPVLCGSLKSRQMRYQNISVLPVVGSLLAFKAVAWRLFIR